MPGIKEKNCQTDGKKIRMKVVSSNQLISVEAVAVNAAINLRAKLASERSCIVQISYIIVWQLFKVKRSKVKVTRSRDVSLDNPPIITDHGRDAKSQRRSKITEPPKMTVLTAIVIAWFSSMPHCMTGRLPSGCLPQDTCLPENTCSSG